MQSREPVFEKSRSVEDVHHLRLMALLRELVRNKGVMKATQALSVDYRTLTKSLKDGRLSRRMRQALEKALLEGGGSPAAEQRERNDRLEEELKEVRGQVEAVGKEAARGVAAVRGRGQGPWETGRPDSSGASRRWRGQGKTLGTRRPTRAGRRSGGPRPGGSTPTL